MPYCGMPKEEDWFRSQLPLQVFSVASADEGISSCPRPDSCNVNLYEDGSNSVGWHSDDEAA